MNVLTIDGSMLEGGGQLLRYSVAYSSVTGKPIRVFNIRAKRSNPGLRPQHMAAVRAAASMCNARVSGLRVGSMEIEYQPGAPRGGVYRVDVGTAGSIGLILQCVSPIAAFSSSETHLELRGGTSVKWAVPVVTLENVVWRIVERMGFRGSIRVLREGFYPRGGGIVRASIAPVRRLKPLRMEDRGEVLRVEGVSICGKLPRHVAERQAKAAERVLRRAGYDAEISVEWHTGPREPLSPGSVISIWAVCSNGAIIGSDSLGERGKPAERVGEEAAERLVAQLETGMAVDRHTADNLIIWCSLADGESVFTTSELTMHTLTAMELAKSIVGAEFEVEGGLGQPSRIVCRGVGLENRFL